MKILKALLRILLFPFAVVGLFNAKTRDDSLKIIRKNVYYLTFIIPLLILLYLVYMNFLPFGFEKTFILDIGVEGDTDSTREFYLVNNGAISPVQRYGDKTFREVLNTDPVEFGFKSPVVIDNDTKVTFSLDFEGNSSIYINNGGKWELFYDPAWNDYALVASFGKKNVYVNPDWISERCWEKLFGEISLSNNLTTVPYAFRGPLEMDLLLEKTLDLTVVKKEKNLLPGEDVLHIELYDEGTLVYEDVIEDDGLHQYGESVMIKRFNTHLSHPGIFKLVLRGEGNMPTDFTLENITINTNKLIFAGVVINPIFKEDASLLYTDQHSDVNFKYWDDPKGKNVVVIGSSNQTVNTFNKTIGVSGETQIYFPRGDVSIYHGRWSLSVEQFFNHFDIDSLHKECIKMYEFENEEKELDSWIYRNIPYGNSIHFHNENMTKLMKRYAYKGHDYDDKGWTEINTQLRGSHQFYVYLQDKMELDIHKTDFNWYEGEDELVIELYDSDENLVFSEIIGDDGISDNSQITNSQNVSIETPLLTNGLYTLKIVSASEGDDIGIEKIKINTNKIMTIGNLLPLEEVTLHTNAIESQMISFYYWHSGKDQLISITGDSPQLLNLTKEDEGKKVSVIVNGRNDIHIQKGDLQIITDMKLAFNNENLFSLYEYDLNAASADFLVMKNSYGTYQVSNTNNDEQVTLKKKTDHVLKLINAKIEFRK